MRELDVYEFIVSYKKKHDGNSPSMREIMTDLNISSTSVVTYHLEKLERMGLIKRVANGQTRQIEVTGGRWMLERRVR